MKQLITRIDENLHRKLKAQAESEGRSVNSLVTEALFATVSTGALRSQMARRIDLSRRRVIPPQPAKIPSRRAIAELTKGAGTAASEAVKSQRSSR